MLKIRLKRVGTKKKPSYQIVVAEARSARHSSVDKLGHFDPLTNPETVSLDEEKALQWLRQGAQPTEAVLRFLQKRGIMEKFQAQREKGKPEEMLPEASEMGSLSPQIGQ